MHFHGMHSLSESFPRLAFHAPLPHFRPRNQNRSVPSFGAWSVMNICRKLGAWSHDIHQGSVSLPEYLTNSWSSYCMGFELCRFQKKALVVLESMVNSRWKYNAGLSDSQSVSVFIKSCCNPKIQCFHFGLQELVISRPVGGKTRVVCWHRTSAHMRRRRAAFDFCSRISYSFLQRRHQAPFPQKNLSDPLLDILCKCPEGITYFLLGEMTSGSLIYLQQRQCWLERCSKCFRLFKTLLLEWFNVPSLAFQNLRSASHTSTTVTLAKCWAGPFSEKTAGLLNSPKTKIINGIMLVIFPCPFVHVSLWRCNLETTDWIVPNPPNADGRTPVAFWGLGFGKVKALLRKPRHEHLLVGDPLNSVG